MTLDNAFVRSADKKWNSFYGEDMSSQPETFFKYERFSVQSLQNLKKQSVFFAAPHRFNDPYDCTIAARFDEPSDDEIERLRNYYRSRPDVPSNACEELEALDTQALKKYLKGIIGRTVEQNITRYLSGIGVCCFSECVDDLLLWAHYCEGFRGYCLEFRSRYFAKARPVSYVEEVPRLNLCAMIIENDYSQLLDLYCTKARAWHYEKEWRAFHRDADTLFTYEADALKGIYFGPKMDEQTIEILCLVLAGQNPNAELWRVKQRPDRFALECERVQYTSLVDAHRRGQIPPKS